MNHHEAMDVLETITQLYPKSELTKKKAQMIIPQFKQMDYQRVMDRLKQHVATSPHPPTVAEIADYPPEKNEALSKIREWQHEASRVPKATKMRFQEQLRKLIMEKSYDD
ncbi:replicative helicase loader/inhibitor [Lentibacillus sp. Marseille-P4043]|uniref:replicative helicase loader/inhibitor n=1 Tax=Lentibacillus sp. Marseille-P4043 TaxID=2040293 RepID=UPI000D0BB26B|nr:replicative helicase loader/inhibitor [Lentibacillus sp. Marseille-P4043]